MISTLNNPLLLLMKEEVGLFKRIQVNIFSWTNFWVSKRKAKDRAKLIEDACHYFGMTLLAFHCLLRKDQDYIINEYKQAKGLS